PSVKPTRAGAGVSFSAISFPSKRCFRTTCAALSEEGMSCARYGCTARAVFKLESSKITVAYHSPALIDSGEREALFAQQFDDANLAWQVERAHRHEDIAFFEMGCRASCHDLIAVIDDALFERCVA